MTASIFWFTGLSGVGKTTLSNKYFDSFKNKKIKIKKIDGDNFRIKNKDKNNFTKKNILNNNYSIIKYINKIKKNYDIILVSVISPLAKSRKLAQKTFKDKYREIFVTCSIKTLEKRDTKGLYKKAKKKLIKNLIGYNSKIKYEQSNYPVMKINTDKYTIQISLKKIKNYLNKV